MDKLTLRGLFVTGTDTGVGKTRISATLAHLLNQRGLFVRPRKPVESGCLLVDGQLLPADATVLQTASGSDELLTQICPYRFELALSPERAAELADHILTLEALAAVCRQDVEISDFLLVEGAGGFYSPLASGVLNADLAVALSLPVLLIASDRLGAINQTLLAVEAIKRRGLSLAGVILNQVTADVDPLMNNAAELSRWLGETVMATGYNQITSIEPYWMLPCPVLASFADRLADNLREPH